MLNSRLLSDSFSVTSYRWQLFSAGSHQFGCGTGCLVQCDDAGLKEPGSALQRAWHVCSGVLILTLSGVLPASQVWEVAYGINSGFLATFLL